ncbi:unnamed protein product [Rhizophagus irregularis]|nr:unnamed protein product [Rhizophagus irregularis]
MELEENQEIVLWGWGWEEIGLTLLIHMVLANRTNPLMKKKMAGKTILKSLRGKSTWQGIVLAIIVGLLMESNLLINRFAPIVICHFLIKIQQRLSLKLNGEIIALTILNDHNLNIDERKAKYRDHEVICEKNWRHKISKYYCEDCFKEETDDREKNRLQFGIYISRTFLNELEALVKLAELSITGGKLFIVPLYGISQDPDTENFILVFKYIESNFHYYYRTQEFNQLILGTKLTCIWEICMSLDICRYGLRPEIRDETPQVLKEIIQKCWDENPENCLTTFDILNQIRFPDNSKLDYKTIEDVYSTFVSLSLDSRSQANYKSRLLDLPNLSELESELASDSMQISTGEIESRSRAVSALEAANLVPFNNIHLDIRQVHPMRCLYNRRP